MKTTSVSPRTISETQLSVFVERGYVPVGRVYSDREVDTLRDALSGIAADEAARSSLGFDQVTADGGQRSFSLVGMFRVDETLRHHAFNPALAAVAAQLLKTDRVRLMTDQAMVKEPLPPGLMGQPTSSQSRVGTSWHQDYSYWKLQPPTQVTCWLALDDVTLESGAMNYVPGSHLLGEYAVVRGAGKKDWGDARPVIPSDPAAAGYETVVIELQAGECVFHHALTWHGTRPNRTNRRRRALITRYMARGTMSRPGPTLSFLVDRGDCAMTPQLVEDDVRYPVVFPPQSSPLDPGAANE